jgi:HEAT repeat protein
VFVGGALCLCIACASQPKVQMKDLRDSDPQVRADAALRLGQAKAPNGVDELIPVLDDPDAIVRVCAVRSLGMIGDRRATAELLPLWEDPNPTIRLALTQALGNLRDPEAVPVLEELLEDNDESIRCAAIRSLAEIPGPAALSSLLNLALLDEKGDVRRRVINVFGKRGAQDAIAPLNGSLLSKNPTVRVNAAEVLGDVGDRSSIPGLVRALDDAVDGVRQASALALAKLAAGNADARAAVRARLEKESEPRVQVDLGWSLARLGDRTGVEALRRLLHQGQQEQVRAAAAEALGAVGDGSDIPRLEKALLDKDGLVRNGAARALSKLRKA